MTNRWKELINGLSELLVFSFKQKNKEFIGMKNRKKKDNCDAF